MLWKKIRKKEQYCCVRDWPNPFREIEELPEKISREEQRWREEAANGYMDEEIKTQFQFAGCNNTNNNEGFL